MSFTVCEAVHHLYLPRQITSCFWMASEKKNKSVCDQKDLILYVLINLIFTVLRVVKVSCKNVYHQMSPVYEVEDFERTVVPAVVEKVCVGENGTRPTKVIRRLQKVLIEKIFLFKK